MLQGLPHQGTDELELSFSLMVCRRGPTRLIARLVRTGHRNAQTTWVINIAANNLHPACPITAI
jgi:hypothetical protein